MSEARLYELFNTRKQTYQDERLKLAIRRVLELQFQGNNPGFVLECCRCQQKSLTTQHDPVYLTGLVGTSVSPYVVRARLSHNLSFICQTCSEAAAPEPNAPSASAGGAAAGPSTAAPAGAAQASAKSPAIAGRSGADAPRGAATAATTAAAGARTTRGRNGAFGAASPAPGPPQPTNSLGSSADNLPSQQQYQQSQKGTANGVPSATPPLAASQGVMSPVRKSSRRQQGQQGKQADEPDESAAATGLVEAEFGAGAASQEGPKELVIDEHFEASTEEVEGKTLQSARIDVSYSRFYALSLVPRVAPSAAAPSALAHVDSATEVAEWAAGHAAELSEADAERLRNLDFSLSCPPRQTLSHTLAAVADWVLAPQLIEAAGTTDAGFTASRRRSSAATAAGAASGALPTTFLAVRLRPWAFAVRENEDIKSYGNCVRPSLNCLGGRRLGKPPTSLLEVLNAPPLRFSAARELLAPDEDEPGAGQWSSSGGMDRAGWLLPVQRLAALLKRRNRKTSGPWRLPAKLLQGKLEDLLEGDAIYHRQPQPRLGESGGAAAASALQLSPVEAFLADLGAAPKQVLEVLVLPDIDANVGFCAECGHLGDLVACDICVDSFCCKCLDGAKPEDLPDPWHCRFCKAVLPLNRAAGASDDSPDVPLKPSARLPVLKREPGTTKEPAARGPAVKKLIVAGPGRRRQSAAAGLIRHHGDQEKEDKDLDELMDEATEEEADEPVAVAQVPVRKAFGRPRKSAQGEAAAAKVPPAGAAAAPAGVTVAGRTRGRPPKRQLVGAAQRPRAASLPAAGLVGRGEPVLTDDETDGDADDREAEVEDSDKGADPAAAPPAADDGDDEEEEEEPAIVNDNALKRRLPNGAQQGPRKRRFHSNGGFVPSTSPSTVSSSSEGEDAVGSCDEEMQDAVEEPAGAAAAAAPRRGRVAQMKTAADEGKEEEVDDDFRSAASESDGDSQSSDDDEADAGPRKGKVTSAVAAPAGNEEAKATSSGSSSGDDDDATEGGEDGEDEDGDSSSGDQSSSSSEEEVEMTVPRTKRRYKRFQPSEDEDGAQDNGDDDGSEAASGSSEGDISDGSAGGGEEDAEGTDAAEGDGDSDFELVKEVPSAAASRPARGGRGRVGRPPGRVGRSPGTGPRGRGAAGAVGGGRGSRGGRGGGDARGGRTVPDVEVEGVTPGSDDEDDSPGEYDKRSLSQRAPKTSGAAVPAARGRPAAGRGRGRGARGRLAAGGVRDSTGVLMNDQDAAATLMMLNLQEAALHQTAAKGKRKGVLSPQDRAAAAAATTAAAGGPQPAPGGAAAAAGGGPSEPIVVQSPEGPKRKGQPPPSPLAARKTAPHAPKAAAAGPSGAAKPIPAGAPPAAAGMLVVGMSAPDGSSVLLPVGGEAVLSLEEATRLGFEVMALAASQKVDDGVVGAWVETLELALARYRTDPEMPQTLSPCLRALSTAKFSMHHGALGASINILRRYMQLPPLPPSKSAAATATQASQGKQPQGAIQD